VRVTGQLWTQPTSLTHHGPVCTQLKPSTRPSEPVHRFFEPRTLASDHCRALTHRPSTAQRRQPGGAPWVGTPFVFRFQPGVANRQTMAAARALWAAAHVAFSTLIDQTDTGYPWFGTRCLGQPRSLADAAAGAKSVAPSTQPARATVSAASTPSRGRIRPDATARQRSVPAVVVRSWLPTLAPRLIEKQALAPRVNHGQAREPRGSRALSGRLDAIRVAGKVCALNGFL
jgi:hypothetical protein